MKLLDTAGHFHPLATAQRMAAQLQAEDEDWTYTVIDCGNGWAYIVVTDEHGETVAEYI